MDELKGTMDDLLRDEEAVRNEAERPDYSFFSFTPEGKPVFGHPPMWGRYVLMAPWELYTEPEPESPVSEPERAPPFFAIRLGYGW